MFFFFARIPDRNSVQMLNVNAHNYHFFPSNRFSVLSHRKIQKKKKNIYM